MSTIAFGTRAIMRQDSGYLWRGTVPHKNLFKQCHQFGEAD